MILVIVPGWNEAAADMRLFVEGRHGIPGLAGRGFECRIFDNGSGGLRARIEQFANSTAYEEAMKVIRRMAKLQSASEHTAFVSQLKERHKRKRNFMKLLG